MRALLAICLLCSALLLVSAGPPNPAVVPFSSDGISFSDCPDWLQEYVTFHNANRDKPTANYMVYACKGETHWCGGLGDRIRGIKFTLRLAYATRRVLLIDDAKPVPLESILAPHLLNWTLAGLDLQRRPNRTISWFSNEQGPDNMWLDYSPFTSSTPIIYLHTNFDSGQRFNPNTTGLRPIPNVVGNGALSSGQHFSRAALIGTSCMMRVLFLATNFLQELYQQKVQELFNETEPAYVAMHFRCGGMGNMGEEQRINRTHDNLVAFMNGLSCARRLAHQNDIKHPVLVLTDNKALRHSIREGYFGAHVITTTAQAAHIDYLPHAGRNTSWVKYMARTVYADLMLLAGGTCLVAPTISGFFDTAWSWGIPACIAPHADKCLHRPLHDALQTVYNLPHKW